MNGDSQIIIHVVPELGGFYLCWKVHTIQEFHL